MVQRFLFNIISGGLPFGLTIFVGGILTIKTKFYQVKNFKKSMMLIARQNGTGISGFSAMCNSLSAAIGTGNIVGVAAAIAVGGPGAVFWMWISAFLGMVIKSAEIALGVFYRQKTCENFSGGPHYYIKNALPKKFNFLAVLFSAFGVLAAFFCGNMTQINSALSSLSNGSFLKVLVGVFSAIITAWVIGGGVRKIASFLSKILPFMAVLYVALCMGVVLKNISALPSVFYNIFVGAFYPKAVTGGAVGSVFVAVSVGASKGIFSNEAGVGTAAVAHGMVNKVNPQTESLYGIFEVFVDTILLCTLTALTILSSGVIIEYNSTPSSALTIAALSSLYGGCSAQILNVMLWLFGISSVIGWATYGISFSEFLMGRFGKQVFVKIYPLFCVFGALISGEIIWRLAELFNGVLVIINLFVITLLLKKCIILLKGNCNDK